MYRNTTTRFLGAACALTAVLALGCGRGPSAEEQPADASASSSAAASTGAAVPAVQNASTTAGGRGPVNADAVKAVERMGTYLRSLPSFQVKSEFTQDDVLDDGQRISFGGTVDMVVQKPNHMRAEIMTDKQQRLYLYDGASFTLFARRMNVYATVPAPKTLGALADELADKYDLEFPLADLFYWGERKTDPFLSAIDVGPSQIGGTTCVHYAFRQEGVDWQVWIQQGEFPLPRKLIVTTTSDATRPQYSSVLTWNLAPSFNDAAFTFTPPQGAQRIVIRQVSDGGSGK